MCDSAYAVPGWCPNVSREVLGAPRVAGRRLSVPKNVHRRSAQMSMTSAGVPASRPRRGVVTTPRKPTGRSKVTNGVTILHGLTDGRTHAARRYRDLVAMVCSDHGGADRM